MKTSSEDSWLLFVGKKKPIAVTSITALRRGLRGIRRSRYAEVTLTWGDLPRHNLCVLLNKSLAWCCYSRKINEACFSSRAPRGAQSEKLEIEFMLSNGQQDLHPANQAVPTRDALKALEHLFQHERLAPWIRWHRDV